MAYPSRNTKPEYTRNQPGDVVLHEDGFVYTLRVCVGVETENVYAWLAGGGKDGSTLRRISERNFQPMPHLFQDEKCADPALCDQIGACIHINGVDFKAK